MTLVNTPHDHFFKDAMTNLTVAKEFFERHLPALVQSQLNLETLALQSGSYIDQSLKRTASDVLYTVDYASQPGFGYLYVLTEHQSSVDMLMPLRLWRYIISIWSTHLKKYPGSKLPAVIPLVFYNGPQIYDGPRDIRELIEAPPELIDQFLLKPFDLVDVSTIPDEEIRQKQWCGLLEYAMKCSRAKEALNYVETFIELLKGVCQSGGIDYGTVALQYFITQTETNEPGKLLKTLEQGLNEEGQIMATVAQYLREQGMQQGVKQGESTLLMHLLERKFKAVSQIYRQRVEQANAADLLRWGEKVLDSQAIEDVFDL